MSIANHKQVPRQECSTSVRAFSPRKQSERQGETDSEGSKATGGAPTGALALYGEAARTSKAQHALCRKAV